MDVRRFDRSGERVGLDHAGPDLDCGRNSLRREPRLGDHRRRATVAHTNVIERAERERIVSALADGHDPDAREQARAALADTIVDGLGDDEIDRILDAIASSTPPARPGRHWYHFGRDDWLYALGIVAIDVGLVVPVVLPLILVNNSAAALYISRLVAAVMFAAIGWGYARNLNHNPWLAAIVLGGLGFGLFTGAYAAGW